MRAFIGFLLLSASLFAATVAVCTHAQDSTTFSGITITLSNEHIAISVVDEIIHRLSR